MLVPVESRKTEGGIGIGREVESGKVSRTPVNLNLDMDLYANAVDPVNLVMPAEDNDKDEVEVDSP